MRVLVVGGGGREHALAHYLSRSRHGPELFVAPGNAGTVSIATNVGLPASDIDDLLNFAKTKEIDLTVVGPEQPLTDGIVDIFREHGLRVLGPNKTAAQLEGSKAFAKDFMRRHGIPTADFRTFRRDEYEAAVEFVHTVGAPLVVKASGLAAGKGAVVCQSTQEAVVTLSAMMEGTAFGDAADQVVVESFLDGEEASLFALCDGTKYVVLPTARDHKRIGDGDTGPNTGGMGAYAPAAIMTDALVEAACRKIVEPTLNGMAREGVPYTGFLYVGLMIGPRDELNVVEYNCRLGDPEAQVVLPLLETDAVDLFMSACDGTLGTFALETRAGAAAVVVMASQGYPGRYPKGKRITGLGTDRDVSGTYVYHAGTRRGADGNVFTNGGRVLGVTGVGDDLQEALDLSYERVAAITFEGAQFRKDIGRKGLLRLASMRS